MKIADVILHTAQGEVRYSRMAVIEPVCSVETADTITDAFAVHFDPGMADHVRVYFAACGGNVIGRVARLHLPGGGELWEIHIEPDAPEQAKGEAAKGEAADKVPAPSAAWFARGGNA